MSEDILDPSPAEAPETPQLPPEPRFKVHDNVVCTSVHHSMFGRYGRVVSINTDPVRRHLVEVAFEAEALGYSGVRYTMNVDELRDYSATQRDHLPPIFEMDQFQTIFSDIEFELSSFEFDWTELEAAWKHAQTLVSRQYPEVDDVKRRELSRRLFAWRLRLILSHHLGRVIEDAMGEKIVPPLPPNVAWS